MRAFWIAAYALLSVGLGATLGWLTIQRFPFGELLQLLSGVNPLLLASAIAVGLAGGYLRGVRWRVLLRSHRVSIRRLFLISQASLAVDAVSVVPVFAEAIEGGILTVRDRFDSGRVLAGLAMQLTLEFTVTVIVVAGGVLLLPPLRPLWPYAAAGLGAAGTSLVLLFTVGPTLGKATWLARFQFVRDFTHAVGLMRAEWQRSLLAFGLTLGHAALVSTAGWLTATAVDVPINVLAAGVVTHLLLFFSTAVPSLPFAFGTFDFAAVNLLAPLALSGAQAGALALALRSVLHLPAIAIAALFLPREGLASLGGYRRLAASYRETRQ